VTPGSDDPLDASSDALAPAETTASYHDLEMALAQALSERDEDTAAVEAELGQLSRIYQRMRGDIRTIEEERDRVVDAAREEREQHERERSELAERLERAMLQEDSNRPVDAAALRERFVLERLADLPSERRKVPEEGLPDMPGFEMLGRLGTGGMASVFHARRKADGVEVAIKLLHDGADSGRVRTEMFLREAAVMLQLEHPGLVGALDAGDCAYGRYLVMEHVAGESLAERGRRERRIAEAEILTIAIHAARALAYCARLGVIHRDVKPGNLMLTPGGQVKLCDFGLTALSNGDDPARPYGSPGYASPEQFQTPKDVDERADIYGLGCTLWHCVAGRRPFSGPAKQAFDDAKTVDLPDPRLSGADVSPGFAQVLRRMGRADRAKRYRNWNECLIDLMLVEKGNPPFAAHLAEARDPDSGGAATIDQLPGVPVAADHPTTGTTQSDETTGTIEAPARPWAEPAANEILPPPRRESRPGHVATLLAGAFLTAAMGFLTATLTRPDPIDGMRDKARALARSGDPAEAARCLREAARLAPADLAEDLLWEADVIEKK
jgi:serine/threonine-protein kinase